MSLFHYEGPINRIGTVIADIIILSIIWILFSIPLFTIGASSTALYYVCTRRISDKEGYLFKDFWKSFRANFFKSSLLWLLGLVLTGFIFLNLHLIVNLELRSDLRTALIAVQLAIFFELLITSLYLYPIIARFEMAYSQTIKSAFFMANRHILTSIAIAALAIFIVLAAMAIWPIFLVGMGLYAYITSHIFMHIFKKYKPEI